MNIAIIDDEKKECEHLSKLIRRYEHETGEQMNIAYFSDVLRFLETYRGDYNAVFMDVDMPLMDGMTAAKKLRALDSSTALIFVTKMAQYAVKGYEVRALDYIVKPVSYQDFYMKFRRIAETVRKNSGRDIVIRKGKSEVVKVDVSAIRWIEVSGHKCLIHLAEKDIECYSSLGKLKERLGDSFLQCNSYCLVNPSYITKAAGLSVWIGREEIPVSHPKKKEFFRRLNVWIDRYTL